MVIGIHTPETAAERIPENVRAKTKDAAFNFPVLVDTGKKNWQAWGNTMWPSVYLIDKQGYVRHWWMGELNWQGAEGEKLMRGRLRSLLAE